MLALTLTWTGVALELATLAALAYRRRLRRLLMLPALLVAVVLSTLVFTVWPEYNTWSVWLASEATHAGMALMLGIELALRMTLRVPHARREARQRVIPILLALGTIALVNRGAPPTVAMLPLANIAVASLYVGLTLVARHNLIPVEPLHATVLHGFTAYLLVYALGWTLTGADTRLVALLNAVAFNALMLGLLWAAWRDDTPRDAPESTLLHFWPWRRFEHPPARNHRRGPDLLALSRTLRVGGADSGAPDALAPQTP